MKGKAHSNVQFWVGGSYIVISGPLVRTVMVDILNAYHEDSVDILQSKTNKPTDSLEPNAEEISVALSILQKERGKYANPEIGYAIEALMQHAKK